MRILIDLQACQSGGSRFRGIGRYSLSLIKAMLDEGPEHEYILFANANLYDLRSVFSAYCSDSNRRVHYCQWYAPSPSSARWPENHHRRHIAVAIREYAIRRCSPDWVLITSLFEGYGDDCVHSVDRAAGACPTAVIHYDLIPLIQADTYLKPQPGYASFYYSLLEELKQASLLLAISNYAAQEASESLGLAQERLRVISSACDTKLFSPEESDACLSPLLQELPKSGFILYSGAGDPRKNLKRLVQAFAKLSDQTQSFHPLLLVGKLCDEEVSDIHRLVASLRLNPKHVILAGYVDDLVLATLYRRASVFVLPSLHEGFGLPALEAMSCGGIVIGSNCTSIPEVIGDEEALFDPYDVDSIASVLMRALTDSDFQSRLRNNAPRRAALFSWSATAREALKALEDCRLHDFPTNLTSASDWSQITQEREQDYRALCCQVLQLSRSKRTFFGNAHYR